MTGSTVEALVCAYLVAGTVQYAKLIWAARTLMRYSDTATLGIVVKRALMLAKPSIVLGVIATWPIASFRALRPTSRRRLGLIEPVVFVVLVIVLS